MRFCRDRLAHLEAEEYRTGVRMSDEDVIAAFSATIESRIPASQAAIVEVENDPVFSEEYKAWQIGYLRKDIATAEQELIGFDNLMQSIRRT